MRSRSLSLSRSEPRARAHARARPLRRLKTTYVLHKPANTSIAPDAATVDMTLSCLIVVSTRVVMYTWGEVNLPARALVCYSTIVQRQLTGIGQ